MGNGRDELGPELPSLEKIASRSFIAQLDGMSNAELRSLADRLAKNWDPYLLGNSNVPLDPSAQDRAEFLVARIAQGDTVFETEGEDVEAQVTQVVGAVALVDKPLSRRLYLAIDGAIGDRIYETSPRLSRLLTDGWNLISGYWWPLVKDRFSPSRRER